MTQADKFDVSLCLINPLIDAVSQRQMETNDAHIIERTSSYSIYDFMGREWKVPDAFLGFFWALREKGSGFDGLLDTFSCKLIDKFTRELPSCELPRPTRGTFEEIISGLRELRWNKMEAEQAARYIMQKYPNASSEEKIRHVLSD